MLGRVVHASTGRQHSRDEFHRQTGATAILRAHKLCYLRYKRPLRAPPLGFVEAAARIDWSVAAVGDFIETTAMTT
jgi:hypothetical protein